MLRTLPFSLSVLFLLAPPALAQDQGVAFSQAANGAYGNCFGTEMSDTMGCAYDQCVTFGGDLCGTSLWCAPHQWTAAIRIQTADAGFFDFLCNEPSFEQVEAVAAVTCDVADYVTCEIIQVWDPDGVAQYEAQ